MTQRTEVAPRTRAGRVMLDWLNRMQKRTGWAGVPGTPAILAIEDEMEREVRERSVAPLDVERLAAILRKGNIGCDVHNSHGNHMTSDHKEDATFIAAEYARLAASATPPTEETDDD